MKKAPFRSTWLFGVGGLFLLPSISAQGQYLMINSHPTAWALVTVGLDHTLAMRQQSIAQTQAKAVVQSSVKDESVRAYAYLVLARAARLEGQNKQARQYYKQMLDLAEYPVLRNEAF